MENKSNTIKENILEDQSMLEIDKKKKIYQILEELKLKDIKELIFFISSLNQRLWEENQELKQKLKEMKSLYYENELTQEDLEELLMADTEEDLNSDF